MDQKDRRRMLYSPQLHKKLHQPLGYLPYSIVPSSPSCTVYSCYEQISAFHIPNNELPRLEVPVILNHPSKAPFVQLSIPSLLRSRSTDPPQSTHHTPQYLTSDISYQPSFLRHRWVSLPLSDNLWLALKIKEKYKRMPKASSLPGISFEIRKMGAK
jgi:hypothetical protein